MLPAFAAFAQARDATPASKQALPAAAARTADQALVEARQAFVRDDPARFEAAAAQVGEHPLAQYVEFWRLRMALRSQTTAQSDAELIDDRVARFIAAHRGTVVADLMRRDWMLDLGRRGRWDVFDSQYAAWVLRSDDEVHCYHWLGRVEQGEPADGALAQLDAADPLADACGELLGALYARGLVDRSEVYWRLLRALEGSSRAAVDRVAGLLGFEPQGLDDAWSRPVPALAGAGRREIVLIALVRLAREDPHAAADHLAHDAGPLTESERSFVRAQIAASAMRRLAPEAYEWTRRALHAPISDITRVWLARAALREQDWPMLNTIIGQMDEQTRSQPAWTYWQARALAAGGDGEAAQDRYRMLAGGFHFYGKLAAEELGEPFRAPPRTTPPTADELAEAAGRPGFARALKFYEIGLQLEGNREWNYQLRGLSDRELLAAAHWACARQALDRCVNTAERTREEHDFALRFVAPFRDELVPVAAARGLDPAWIYGLIRQESRFVTDARSPAGAQGLMQIMPATGRWIAGKLGVKRFSVAQLGELPTNLEFGTFYLRHVLDELGGSPVLASAAYNAGPGRPRTWRETLPGPVEGAIFAEIIPFSETRDYVKKVLSNAVVYAALFTGEPRSLKDLLGQILPPPTALASNEPLESNR